MILYFNFSLFSFFFYSLQDVSASLSKRYPELYKAGIRNTFFTWKVVAIWAFFSIYQSLIIYYFTAASSPNGHNASGKVFGLWDVSTMSFTCIVVTVNLRLLMACNSITRWHHISVWGSILAWFLFIFIYSGIMTPRDRQVSLFLRFFYLPGTCSCIAHNSSIFTYLSPKLLHLLK